VPGRVSLELEQTKEKGIIHKTSDGSRTDAVRETASADHDMDEEETGKAKPQADVNVAHPWPQHFRTCIVETK